MKNMPWKTLLNTALLALTLGVLPALAEPDNFGLGTGRNGAVTFSTPSNIINSYAQVTGPLAHGDTSIPVGTCMGSAACFAAGDLVMVLQTTGIVPEPPSGSPITIDLTIDPVGRWEFARVASVAGSILNLTQPLVSPYAANVTQIIRVPEYTSVTILAGRRISPSPWNGSAGGVVAFLANGTFTNNGVISASGQGFRGGLQVDDPSGELGCTDLDEPAPRGALKGEGIAVTRFGAAVTGRGSVANAGAGGVCLSAGGGGGGNGGAGGRGGNTDLFLDGNRAMGGEGGAALHFSMLDHLMMGGGGGAGHTDMGEGAGGKGGGIVFIRAYQMNGSGSILANGGAGSSSMNAGNGGGAGGTIYLRLADKATCGTLQANGGMGGHSNSISMGPGGGGGGGRVLLLSGPDSTCNVTPSDISGGSPGVQMNPDAPGGPSYGAEAGSMGTTMVLPAPVVVTPANNSSTNNATPTYTGTLMPPYPAGTEVAIYVDSVEVAKVAPDATGNWFATHFAPLSDGAHTVYAVTRSSVQRTQSAPSNINIFTVDTTPPATPRVTTPANGSTTNNITPIYSGTAEAGSTVTVAVDGVEIGVVIADASGAWSLRPVVALADGTYGVSARATDAAGNTSFKSDIHFTVDTTPPAAPRVTTPANGSVTNSNRPLYSGTAEADSTVTVVVDGMVVGTTAVHVSGAWNLRPVVALADGSHGVSAQVTDVAGNIGAGSDTHLFTVDTTPPAAPRVTTPANGSTTTHQPTYSGTAEAGNTVTVVVDGVVVGTTTATPSGTWSFLQPPLTAGSHTVRTRAKDMVDNTGADSDTHFFTVDATPPAAPMLITPTNGSTLKSNRPLYSGTAEADSTVMLFVDGVVVGTTTANASGGWSLLQLVALADVSHTVRARAMDVASNTSADSDTHFFTVDTAPPAAPRFTTPANGSRTRDNTPTYSGLAEAGSTVTVVVDGVVVGTTAVHVSGSWTLTPVVALADGAYGVSARATDVAGNTGTDSDPYLFTVDTTPPAAPRVTTPANGSATNSNRPLYSGTAEAGSTIMVMVNGVVVGLKTADGSGEWTLRPEVPLADVTLGVSARATDVAGNTGADSDTYLFTVDTVAPTAPVVTAPGASIINQTPVIGGIAEPGSKVTVLLDGKEVTTTIADESWDWSFTPSTPLDLGNHSISAIARDEAGNASPDSSSYRFAIERPRSHYGWSCAAAPATPATWAMLALVWSLGRRRLSSPPRPGAPAPARHERKTRGPHRSARPGSAGADGPPGSRWSSGASARAAPPPPGPTPAHSHRSRRWPAHRPPD